MTNAAGFGSVWRADNGRDCWRPHGTMLHGSTGCSLSSELRPDTGSWICGLGRHGITTTPPQRSSSPGRPRQHHGRCTVIQRRCGHQGQQGRSVRAMINAEGGGVRCSGATARPAASMFVVGVSSCRSSLSVARPSNCAAMLAMCGGNAVGHVLAFGDSELWGAVGPLRIIIHVFGTVMEVGYTGIARRAQAFQTGASLSSTVATSGSSTLWSQSRLGGGV